MRVFKTAEFAKWAKKAGITDVALLQALHEIDQGLVDADLGGGILKKRIAYGAKGKSGGVRVLLACKMENCAFFLYGFYKNEQSNITDVELRQLKRYAKLLFNFKPLQLEQLVTHGELMEINDEKQKYH